MLKLTPFKQVFCEIDGCAPEKFINRLIVCCVPFRWRLVTRLVLRLKPAVLAVELAFVEHLGTATTLDEVSARMREYRGDLARARVERRAITWGWRLRTGRVLALARDAWRDLTPSTRIREEE